MIGNCACTAAARYPIAQSTHRRLDRGVSNGSMVGRGSWAVRTCGFTHAYPLKIVNRHHQSGYGCPQALQGGTDSCVARGPACGNSNSSARLCRLLSDTSANLDRQLSNRNSGNGNRYCPPQRITQHWQTLALGSFISTT